MRPRYCRNRRNCAFGTVGIVIGRGREFQLTSSLFPIFPRAGRARNLGVAAEIGPLSHRMRDRSETAGHGDVKWRDPGVSTEHNCAIGFLSRD